MTRIRPAAYIPEVDRGKPGTGVTAVLGPTNTGKTHFAIERMLAHPSGIIGLPLRLLAREVYGRVVEKVGAENVALITGEEKIKPRQPRYWVATVEAMPRDLDVSFLAVDEIQIAANLDRGHVFTDRLLHRRGRDETLIIGASTMRRAVEQLLPGATIVSRPRLSKLSFAGEKKLSRLPHRSAIVAFSAEEVYAIAELIRRQRGGAAVVLGALSPRTRNAQVALFQNGDVDYLVATDAIGMGLNLDLDHVAFAGDRKFDGWQFRRLNPAEMGQIAGRAGRHLRDGTFGTTGRCPPFDEELIEALEDHRFDPVPILQWRNSDLDFGSIEDLQASLDRLPEQPGLTRAPIAEDVMVLDIAARDEGVRKAAKTRADVARLWDVCQVPDYRKLSPSAHAELALTLFGYVVRARTIPDSWFGPQLAAFDRTEGDIDTLSSRIAQVRTLTYIANRPDWLADPEHWQGVTRQLEDRLSDALHERLAQRFVDRRTSVLMRRLRENAMLEAEITPQGDVLVEEQHVGQLHGFRFTPDPLAAGEAARALNAAALKALGGEIEARAERFSAAVDESFALANDGTIRWLGDPVAKLAPGDKLLAPRARVVADEYLTGTALETVQRRLDLWLAQHIKKHLGPLIELETGEGLEGIARGIAYQVAESLGVLERSRVAEEMKGLDQAARGTLRKLGLRFGAYHIYMPALVKPAPRALAAQLWALRHGGVEITKGLDEVPHFAASGRTSFAADPEIPKGLYRAAGFRVCGNRAVRVDILERLADLIRPAIAYRPGTTPGAPPPGTADGDGFVTTVSMTSLAGCSGEDFASILRSLGYVLDRRAGPAITVPLLPRAPTQPLKPEPAEQANSGAAEQPAGEEHGSGAAEASSPEPALDMNRPDEAAEAERPSVDASPAEGEADGASPAVSLSPDSAIEGVPAEPEAHPTEPVAEEQLPQTEEAESSAEAAQPARDETDAAFPQASADPAPDSAPLAAIPDTSVSESSDDSLALPEGAASLVHQAKADSAGDHAAPAEDRVEISDPDEQASAAAAAPAMETSVTLEPQAPSEPAEPVLIEVWRPHRTNHHAHRRPERGRPRPGPRTAFTPPVAAQGEAASAPVSTEAPENRRRGFRPNDRHRDKRPGEGHPRERAPGVAATAAPGGDTPPSQEAGARPPRHGDGKARFAPRRGDERRPDERRERRNENSRNEGGRVMSSAPAERQSRERQPDPNSPFAKLLSLKLEMERNRDK